jgi:deoxyribonuclease IV
LTAPAGASSFAGAPTTLVPSSGAAVLLGAHVSTAGGVPNAPERGAQIAATAIQLFTKQPNRWAEPEVGDDEAAAFREARREHGIRYVCVHDSYLINLATADPTLRARSLASFRAELARANRLGLDAVVTHPGNATDGDPARGLAQNAALIQQALLEEGGEVRVLIETTAGSGRVLGATFEELAEMIDLIEAPIRDRIGICFDTCHVFAAGYDLRDHYDRVMERLDATVGLARLACFHLNDSMHPLGSRRDRHAGIAEGTLGEEPFRRIMNDHRFADVPKILETPKGDDPVAADRLNLERLLRFLP